MAQQAVNSLEKKAFGVVTALAIILSASVDALEHGETCTTPSRVRGTCIEVRDCPSLVTVLQVKPLPQATIDFVRRSKCGFRGRGPLVCCPSSGLTPTSPSVPTCTTPSRVRGTCIGVRDCPSLLTVLQVKPLPQATLDYVRRSKCGFRGRVPLVCCPSSELTPTSPPVPTTVSPEETEDVSQHPNIRFLRQDLCGPYSVDRIINGKRARLNELPWMTLIAYTVGSRSQFRCGGSIINERYILTAAHCVKFLPSTMRPVSVRLGEHDLKSGIDCEELEKGDPDSRQCAPAPQDIPIDEIIPHPLYVGKPNHQNDIALIRLSRAADFTPDSVRPICLPIGLPIQTVNLVNKKVVVSGWGVTEKAQSSTVPLKATVPVMAQRSCATAFKVTVPISGVSQICAGGVRDGGNPCYGDSGGPLTYHGNVKGSTRTVQHGVVSYGPRICGSPGKPGVFTRVGHFMKWILDTIKA